MRYWLSQSKTYPYWWSNIGTGMPRTWWRKLLRPIGIYFQKHQNPVHKMFPMQIKTKQIKTEMKLTEWLEKQNKFKKVTYGNVGDIFTALKHEGIKEIELDAWQMKVIVDIIAANSRETDDTLKIMREGKIDKFLGVNLIDE